MIDNYDSFTWNLVHYFEELGQQVIVHRNDALTVKEILALHPQYIVISPGPCTPNEAGVSLQLIRGLQDQVPLLGVCLGHQSIAQALGGTICHAQRIMHGKTSAIWHDGKDLFTGLDRPFTATRYHSLVIDPDHLPDCLDITAWTQCPDGRREEIMAIRHREWPMHGVQFHPESILSTFGHALLKNFLQRYARPDQEA